MRTVRAPQTAALAALLALAATHVAVSPFTKVEESFNAQAMHDVQLLLQKRDMDVLASFDHHEFPGVVPRTFVGAITVAAASWPLRTALETAAPLIEDVRALAHAAGHDPDTSAPVPLRDGILSLYAMRGTLAILVWLAFVRLSVALTRRFGNACGTWFAVVCCCQFHLVFYLGRPLPNTFAMALSAYALARWLESSWEECVGILAFCTVVFRCDTIILTAWVCLMILARRETNIFALVVDGIASGTSSLFLTFAVDSFMWDRPVWPEGSVLFFNTVLNKSHEWGVLPPHWYFTNALPKALMAALPLSILGILQPLDRFAKSVPDLLAAPATGSGLETSRKVLESMVDLDVMSLLWFPAVGYVATYSLLPHKEVRFLFQVFPYFNALAALGLARLQWAASSAMAQKKESAAQSFSLRRVLARLGLVGAVVALLASAGVATAHLAVSAHNYPGADALMYVQNHHEKYRSSTPAKVHYCVYAAMSGITRFVEHGPRSLSYSKREDEAFEASLCASKEFDYLIMEPSRVTNDEACKAHFEIIYTAQGKPKMIWREARIATEPALYVLQRKQ
ncbi:Dol-P-Man:Man7GlcNAc2-PP-Dol alpha-1,6-mannosyltransferase [Hondaea fermentalgiana]|uniref:Mannosyltransferase n=1 Tax=Hondaea fermentalgiana TaxID=2315210 RepID=A0A2R5GIT0_9STRA|nr:Dol-P-Man:Man7GlcNAc2-PP-Dol alpha-1,6-mannosyltransferase [Hondaea fermentalgiana]|eukprot:GBG30800.1 Dol-P-Man:Man7GlcNAc2-PP-Dol alpha-1,6-mannosyltransferase [Hondaea fermentalgiana]